MSIGSRLTGFAVMLLAGAASAAPPLDAVDEKLRTVWNEQKAVTAHISVTSKIPLGDRDLTARASGNLACMRHNGTSIYRQLMSANLEGMENGESTIDMVFDGENLRMVTGVAGVRHSVQTEPNLSQGTPPGGAMLLDVLRDELDLRVRGEEPVDGVQAYVLEGTRKPGAAIPFERATVFLEKDTGLLRRLVMWGKENQVLAEMKLHDVVYDAPITAEDILGEAAGEQAAPEASEKDGKE